MVRVGYVVNGLELTKVFLPSWWGGSTVGETSKDCVYCAA